MKILIIEDDSFFQNFYSAKLKEIGFEVETAFDGEDGVVKARNIKPDLILLDLILPKKDGFEVLQTLKGEDELKNIPVLIFSALGQETDIERARELGAVDYINKGAADFKLLKFKIMSYIKK